MAENEREITDVVAVEPDVLVNDEVPYHFVPQSCVRRRRKRKYAGEGTSKETEDKPMRTPFTKDETGDAGIMEMDPANKFSAPVEAPMSTFCLEEQESVLPSHPQEGSVGILLDREILQRYVSAVSNCAGFTSVDSMHKAFIIHDLHEKTSNLTDNCVIVRRRALQICQEYTWVYACSCHASRWEIVDTLSSVLDDQCHLEKYPKCLHIQAAEILVQDTDMEFGLTPSLCFHQEAMLFEESDHVYVKRQKITEFHGLESLNTAMCVTTYTLGEATTYDAVIIDLQGDMPKLKCTSHSCRNISDSCRHVKSVLDSDELTSDVHETFLKVLNEKPKWRSRYVPVAISEDRIMFSGHSHGEVKEHKRENMHLEPEIKSACVCGYEWTAKCTYRDCFLFEQSVILTVKVGFCTCSNVNCDNVKYYDGAVDEILHMGAYLISHSVLRRYMRQFVTEGSTMISFHKEWAWQQQENGNLDFTQKLSYYRHNERVFIPNIRVRKLLREYTTGGLTEVEGKEMLDGIKQHQPNLAPLLKQFFDEDFKTVCPEVYTKFLKMLCSSSPVCGWLHYCNHLFHLVERISQGEDFKRSSEDLVMLKEKCPVLSSLLTGLKMETVSEELGLVLRELLQIAKRPFLKQNSENVAETHNLPTVNHSDQKACSCHQSHLGFFPGLPVKCHRGNYTLDKKKESVEKCTKRGSSHPTLSPGLFTISCEHGICYGFQLMENVESPNLPFTLIRTRFSKSPTLII